MLIAWPFYKFPISLDGQVPKFRDVMLFSIHNTKYRKALRELLVVEIVDEKQQFQF